MSPTPEPGFRRLARACPHCGAREPTLGSECPRCGQSYEPRSAVERVGDFGSDWAAPGSSLLGLGAVLVGGLGSLLSILGHALLALGRRLRPPRR